MKVINNKKGFTLIELLVVVAIIGILSSVGVVAYNGYTAGAKESACKGNFRTIVKAVYENIMWCELNPTINFLWNAEQSREYTCGTMEHVMGFTLPDYFGVTPNEKIAFLTGNEITNIDLLREGALVEGRNLDTGSRSTITTLDNPYGKTYNTWAPDGNLEYFNGDRYDFRGLIGLIKKDSSESQIDIGSGEGQMYLVTKCRDKVIEHKLDIY